MTISPNKVNPEIRDTVIMYQQECDDVLWEYWTKGQAINQRLTISPEQQNALHEIVDRRAGRDRSLRASMWIRHNRHFGIAKYSQLLSIHFDEAKQYLELLPLQELVPAETDTLKRLEKFVDNLAARYPALENPLAYDIAQQLGEELKYQSPKGPKTFGYRFKKAEQFLYSNIHYTTHQLMLCNCVNALINCGIFFIKMRCLNLGRF